MIPYLARISIGIFICFTVFLQAQEPVRKASWFQSGRVYPVIRLDYKEHQITGSLYGIHALQQWQNRALALFSAGFQKSLVRWNHDPGRQSEVGAALTVFTQYIFEKPFEQFQANLFNIDFQVGAHYSYRMEQWRFRGRLYHISAHLGDDYIFRYEIKDFIDNPRIYEVVDASVAWQRSPWLVYGTAGVIFHSAYERRPILLQLGSEWEVPIGKKKQQGWMAGVDIRMEQEQDFRPGIHMGTGLVIGRERRVPITIMADYYHGFLPYSLYDHVLVHWLGASLCFQVF